MTTAKVPLHRRGSTTLKFLLLKLMRVSAVPRTSCQTLIKVEDDRCRRRGDVIIHVGL